MLRCFESLPPEVVVELIVAVLLLGHIVEQWVVWLLAVGIWLFTVFFVVLFLYDGVRLVQQVFRTDVYRL